MLSNRELPWIGDLHAGSNEYAAADFCAKSAQQHSAQRIADLGKRFEDQRLNKPPQLYKQSPSAAEAGWKRESIESLKLLIAIQCWGTG